jgi:hypothetical protein
LKLLVDCATFIISRVIASTEYKSDIFRSILSVTELGGVGTDAFDASRFVMAIIFCVSVALEVGTLGYFPFVPRRFKFDSALLRIFNEKYVLVLFRF